SRSPEATTRSADCAPAPTDGVRITRIPIPPTLEVAFAACSAWLGSENNGGGINRLDLRTNKVVANVKTDDVVHDVAANDDEVWAIVSKAIMGPNDAPQLVRIDPTTNRVAETIPLPFGTLSMTFAIVEGKAWIGGHRLSS